MMSIGRRISTDSRRRRVLLYQSSRAGERDSSADRRTVEKLRQARRPATIYGASVKRRLRGRWFSLVPVRRRAMAGVSLAILGAALLLCLAHWLAITWQPLAYREALARPLRLDRPDSFGTWTRASLLAVAAGASLLVYQLRRYRNDDYRGSYRIWPPVIILIALASLDCIVALVPWCGELIDVLLGKRVAMAGSDWIRIGITIGGAALALRLLAEVRHSKLAMLMLVLSIACFATPLATRWGILLSDTPLKWWLITSAPLMAAATLCVSCVAYLRKLFREVRHLDQDDQLWLRFQQWKQRTFPVKARDAGDASEARGSKPAAEKPRLKSKPTPKPAMPVAAATEPEGSKAADQPASDQPARGKRRLSWLFGRGDRAEAKSETSSPAQAKENSNPPAEDTAATSEAKPGNKQPSQLPEAGPQTGADPAAAPKRRGGLASRLGQWLRRNPSAAASPESESKRKPKAKAGGADPPASRAAAPSPNDDDRDSDDGGDDPSIDWASMGKAERRRLRRELKRSGDAA